MTPSTLKVLFVNQWAGLGGAEISLLRLLERLQDRAVTFLACPPGLLAQEAQRRGAQFIPVDIPPLKRLRRTPADEIHRLAEVVAQVDVVHAYSVRAGWFVGPLCRCQGVPMVWSVHDLFSSLWQRLWLRMVALRYACAVVAYSQVLGNQFGRGLRSRVHLIPHGVDTNQFRPLSEDEIAHVRRRLNTPTDRVVVLHVGRLMPFKGQHLFLQMARHVIQRGYPPPVFWLAGDASMGDSRYALWLQQLSQPLGEAVRWLGFQEDIAPIIGAADILVHCSMRPEPFGLVVIEAMACERVVISANRGAPAEIIESGRTGVLTPPNNKEMLTRAVMQLIADESSRQRMGKLARQLVCERYTLQQHVEALLNLYTSLL